MDRLSINRILSGGQFEHEKTYWLKRLEGAEVTQVASELLAGSKSKCQPPVIVRHALGASKAKTIREICKDSEPAIFVFLLSCVKLFLQKWLDAKETLIGTFIYTESPNADVMNTQLAIRTKTDHCLTFKELVHAVKEAWIEALDHQNYPFAYVAEELRHFGLPEDEFPMKVMVFYEPIHHEVHLAGSNPDLLIRFGKNGESLFCELTCHIPCDRNMLERMAGYLGNVIETVVANPSIGLDQVELLSEEEKRELLELAQSAVRPVGNERLHQRFEKQVTLHPARTAVRCGNTQVTYEELNKKANQIAWKLIKKGIRAEDIAAVMLNRSVETVAALFAIWKAGGVYLPIDPEYPQSRIVELLKDSKAAFLITEKRYLNDELHALCGHRTILLDEGFDEPDPESVGNPDLDVRPDQLAYIIYTSGSTGKPKGAMIEQVCKENHIEAMIVQLNLDASCVIAQNAPQCFDISVWQFITALMVGGQTVIYPNSIVQDPHAFLDQINRDRVTVLEIVVSYMTAILEMEQPPPLPHLQYVLVTGEALNAPLVRKWFLVYPHIRLINAYGPTEAADDITLHVIDRCPDGDSTIPIGRPIPNMRIYLVDSDMHLVPKGMKGELCVAGIGVGRGYLNNEAKTREAFMNDPFSDGPESWRLYRTGDLARWNENGTLEYLGRKDHQVKIRGYRVELGEIDAHLLHHPEVKEAVTLLRPINETYNEVCAYYVSDRHLDPEALRSFLEARIPEYMIPDYFIWMSAMPLTPNGKIDRKALPDPHAVSPGRKAVEPESETERQLLEIWRDVLKHPYLGVTDNFFRVGGNSLLAFAMASRVHKALGVKMPLAEIYQAKTVRDLAGQIERKFASPESKPPYALLNSVEDAPRIFCFPSIFGLGNEFQGLANLLPSWTWYGFHFIRHEGRVEAYAKEIMALQGNGPIVLLGYSAGGNLAFEVARHLESKGITVSDVIFLDSKRSLKKEAGSIKDLNRLRDRYLEKLSQTGLDIIMDIPAYYEEIKSNVTAYTLYHRTHVNEGFVHADLHLILSGSHAKENTWANATKGSCFTYRGSGTHFEMLKAGHLSHNAKLIGGILENIWKRSRWHDEMKEVHH